MASYAIVHATISGQLRRVIADDEGLVTLGTINGQPAVVCVHANGDDGYHPLLPGESAIIQQTQGRAATPHDWKAALKARVGFDPPDITCALVDSNNVVTSIIHADPAVDKSPSPDHLMIHCYSTQIIPGCTYDPATELFTTMEGLIPPHTPGNDTDDPIVVPPQVILKPIEA